ncbi:MAG: type II secretion system protein [Clostridia bacterium]|nr:type II secretion system protein [Clostridia bacterium]
MKNNKGFSLVELIVVIAIMAILATVAVIGVSVYIPRAQKAADAELVNDIIYAVTLRDYETQFASNGNGVVGYVVITNDKNNAISVSNDNDEIHQALVATFGENYEEELRLAYDGWTDADKLLDVALTVKEQGNLDAINNSTFLTQSSTEELLGAVQDCTSLFGKLFENEGKGNEELLEAISYIYMPELKDMITDAEYSGDNLNSAVVSNAVVLAVAQKVSNDNVRADIIDGFTYATTVRTHLVLPETYENGNKVPNSQLDEIATKYAATKALVEYLNKPKYTDIFNQMFNDVDQLPAEASAASVVINNINTGVDLILAELVTDGQLNPDTQEPIEGTRLYDYYYGDGQGETPAYIDGQAYVGMLSAVNEMGDDYLEDKVAMNNSQLFIDSGVTNRVNSFVSLAMLSDSDLEFLNNKVGAAESAVVLLFTVQNGTLSCIPCPAEIMGE